MMRLRDMNQQQLISWIQSLDGGLSSSHKQQIVQGIQRYAQQIGGEVTGMDFLEAEDADDIQELAMVKKKIAKRLLREIRTKIQQDLEASMPRIAHEEKVNEEELQFALCIQGMKGRTVRIRNVTKSWTISQVKSRYMDEIGGYGNSATLEFKKNGRTMHSDRTLEDYGIVNGLHLPLVVTYKVFGGGSPADDEKKDIDIRIKQEIQVIAAKPDAPREKVFELAKKTYKKEGKPVVIDTKDALSDIKQNASNYKNVALPMTLAMDKDFSTWNEQQFKRDFANKFNVPIECIEVVSVKAGSIIADVKLHTHWKDANGSQNSISIEAIADKIDPVIAKKAFAEFAVFAVEFKPPTAGFDCLKQKVIMNPKWNRAYGPGATNWDGPLNDGKSRGGEPYYCPRGWKRFAIQFQETAYDFANVYDKWPIAYHGTKFDFSMMITLSGLKSFGGVYLSPCIEYSAHPRYAQPVKLDFSKYQALNQNWSSDHIAEFRKYDGKWVQCVFACRVKPGSFRRQGETMSLNPPVKIHPDYSNDNMEWVVEEPSGGIVGPDRILIYGIMIRASDEYPLSLPESHWWKSVTWWKSSDPDYKKYYDQRW